MYSNKENINILTSLIIAHGIRHVVVCPGSRNAPLTHNFNECPEIVCHSQTDERSAGFYALGMSQQLNEPVAVCVTSGSALLNLLPAAAEASYQNNGILVISADRPSEWIGQLDGQTMPQKDALGSFVSKSVSLPEPKDESQRWYCNRLINEAIIELKSKKRPSVHINVPISEPLYDFDVAQLPDERVVSSLPFSSVEGIIDNAHRPLLVLGQLQEGICTSKIVERLSSHFVVLTEAISSSFRSYTEELIRQFSGEMSPDLVVYAGGNTVSKKLRQFLRSLSRDVTQIVVSSDGCLHDVSMNTSLLVPDMTSDELLSRLADRYISTTSFAERIAVARKKIAAVSSCYRPNYSGMLAVKMLEEKINSEVNTPNAVYYGNSLSVRYAALYANGYRYCNRGLNGIEGSLSVAAGASLVRNANIYAVIGDLSFFYDENALWNSKLGGNFRILLLNNGGGGIFSGLQGAKKSEAFTECIAARQNYNAEGVCHQFGVKYLSAEDEKSLETAVNQLCTEVSDRPVLLEVKTVGDVDEQEYESYFQYLSQNIDRD